MKLGIVISTNEPENVFNVMRLANFSAGKGDDVGVFLLGKGVELDRIESAQFNIREQAKALLAAGGQIMACGTCLRLRDSEGTEICPLSTMNDLYQLIQDADRVVSF